MFTSHADIASYYYNIQTHTVLFFVALTQQNTQKYRNIPDLLLVWDGRCISITLCLCIYINNTHIFVDLNIWLQKLFDQDAMMKKDPFWTSWQSEISPNQNQISLFVRVNTSQASSFHGGVSCFPLPQAAGCYHTGNDAQKFQRRGKSQVNPPVDRDPRIG